MYKLKHVPTGLYYQPHKHRGSNISKRGKVYQTSTHGLSSAFRSAEKHPDVAQRQLFSIFVEKDSPTHKRLKDVFVWEESRGSYGQMKADTNVSDWVVEEIVELTPPIKRKTIVVISKNLEDFNYVMESYLHSLNIEHRRLNLRRYETDSRIYFAVINSTDLRGMTPDKVFETPNAYQNRNIDDIIEMLKVNMPIGVKIENNLHEL